MGAYLHIFRLTILHHLFLDFWLVNTWFFAHWRHQRAVTSLKNLRQLNIRRGKKLGFQYIGNLFGRALIFMKLWYMKLGMWNSTL